MRILMTAYACEPDVGSEPGVGWHWAKQAALHGHDVHVITRANNRDSIERELASSPVPHLTFHYFDLSQPFMKIKKKAGQFGLIFYYYMWQLRSIAVAKALIERHAFDLVHQVTFVMDWLPSGLSVAGKPLIWGPIGGSSHRYPRHLMAALPRSARIYERIRMMLQGTFLHLDPFVRLTRKRASALLAYTDEALEAIPPRYREKSRSLKHIGIDLVDLPPDEDPSPGWEGSFHVLTGGRLVHWKGFDLLIEGFAGFLASTSADARLVITGEGPFKDELMRLTQQKGISQSVDFVGRLPEREDVYRLLTQCHLYALPTLRDGPPVAILEAMAAGRPILCLDLGATRELVPDGAGFRVSVGDRDEVVRGLADALTAAHADRVSLAAMGRRARDHSIAAHDWNVIGDEVQRVYEDMDAFRAGR